MGNEKELREKLKKLVIMGCHSECSTYDEALQKEEGVFCLVEVTGFDYPGNTNKKIGDRFFMFGDEWIKDQEELSVFKYKIIGQPITIGRVLSLIDVNLPHLDVILEPDFRWIYLTKEGQEATDDDQTIETIKALVAVLEGEE